MIKEITPTVRELVNLLVHAYERSQTERLIIDRERAYTAVDAYARSIVVVTREGVDDPNEQMDAITEAGELIQVLDVEWASKVRDFQTLAREVLRRVETNIVYQPDPTNAELLEEELVREAIEYTVKMQIAERIIAKFGTAAVRWLTGSTEMARFAAEQRADTLANFLVMHLLPKEVVLDPMRIAQDVHNDAKRSGFNLTGQMVAKRIHEALA